MKILVADDEPNIRELVGELLTSAGYDVLEAEDGLQALILIKEKRPDLIVLDLMMPEMAGFDVVREIRRDPRVKNTSILIMSVLVSRSDTDASIRDLDVEGFIDKTKFVTLLIPCVKSILSKQAHRVA